MGTAGTASFTWVGERDLTFFYVELWSRLLELQIHEEAMSAEAPGTTNEPSDRKKTMELPECNVEPPRQGWHGLGACTGEDYFCLVQPKSVECS